MRTIAPKRIVPLRWWRAPLALERFIADLIDAEARHMRPGGPWPRHVDAAQFGAMAPDESGLGFDSLERLGLAAALSEALHLHRGGLADTLMTAPTLGGWVEASATALERFDGLMTVRSSGSTGKRRSHVHAMAQLEAETAFWAGLLPDRLRVRSAVASHHIYGILFTLMLPVALGLPTDDLRPSSPGAVLATLRPGDLVIGHPVFWDLLLRAAPSGWPANVIGVTSGAPCPDATAARLAEAGLTKLIDVYGSSETAGIGWREGTGAHRLLPCWQREPSGMLSRHEGLPVALPDRLHWDNDSCFRIGERCDGGVTVGGVTVDPARVCAVLRAHAGVADAAVRPMRPEEGARLKAFVVPRKDAAGNLDVLRAAIVQHVEAVLTVPERPRAFRFGGNLPLTATGKPADWLA